MRALTKRLQDPNVLVMWFALVGTVLAPIVMLCFGQVWVPLTGSLVWLEACVGKLCVRVSVSGKYGCPFLVLWSGLPETSKGHA